MYVAACPYTTTIAHRWALAADLPHYSYARRPRSAVKQRLSRLRAWLLADFGAM